MPLFTIENLAKTTYDININGSVNTAGMPKNDNIIKPKNEKRVLKNFSFCTFNIFFERFSAKSISPPSSDMKITGAKT